MNKRGEAVSDQLVIWIPLIVSFIIILYVLAQIFIVSDVVDADTCYASVVARDLANTKVFEGSNYLPLSCQTDKICVGGKDCPTLLGTKSAPIRKVDLAGTEVRDKILYAYSEAIQTCDNSLGSGELNFFPSNLRETDYCVICSRIALDEDLKDKAPEKIGYLDLYRTLELDSFEGKNALESVYGVKSTEQIISDYETLISKIERGETIDIEEDVLEDLKRDLNNNFADWTFNPKNEQAVVVKITKEGDIIKTVGGGVAIVGTVLTVTGVGGIIGIPLTAGSAAILGGITYFNGLDKEYYYEAPYLIEYDLEELKNLGCDSFENLP